MTKLELWQSWQDTREDAAQEVEPVYPHKTLRERRSFQAGTRSGFVMGLLIGSSGMAILFCAVLGWAI